MPGSRGLLGKVHIDEGDCWNIHKSSRERRSQLYPTARPRVHGQLIMVPIRAELFFPLPLPLSLTSSSLAQQRVVQCSWKIGGDGPGGAGRDLLTFLCFIRRHPARCKTTLGEGEGAWNFTFLDWRCLNLLLVTRKIIEIAWIFEVLGEVEDKNYFMPIFPYIRLV